MSTETESFPTPPMRPPRGKWLVAVLLFVLGFLILFFASLQYFWPGKWWESHGTLAWNGESLALMKGQGHSAQGKLTINGLTGSGVAFASLSPPAFRAEDYSVVHWSISSSNVKPGAKVEFLWRTAESHNVFVRELAWEGNSVAPLQMTEDPDWRGQIVTLALRAHAPLEAPLVVEGIKLDPFSPLEIVGREWFGAEPWVGPTINFVGGNVARQWLAPLPLVVAALGLAVLGYGLLAWRKILVPDIGMLWVLVFMAWFALDLRWQLDLWQKLGLTQQRYAGKSWEEKHLAAEDGRLFDLIQQAKAKLPSTPSRIFLFADEKYTLGRGAYHLYPHNVLGRDALHGQSADFKSGDFIIILGENEVKFDLWQHLLEWGAGQQLRAELLLLVENNILLLKVR